MKKLNYMKITATMLLTLLIAVFYAACKKEGSEGKKKIVINEVSLHNKNTTDSLITQARLGTIIRLDGAGFSTTRAVYVNGVKISINPGYVTENHIIFQIPSDLPFGKDIQDTSVRNTIRVISKYDDYKYKFMVQGALPVVSGVSHTLPREGETIQLYGSNLRDLTKITFPGNVTLNASQFTVNDDNTVITCVVPAGATTTPGAIKVEGDNGAANSYNFMNRKEGIFIQKFANDPGVSGAQSGCDQRAYNYGTTISGTSSSLLPVSGSGPKNPEYYRQVPVQVSDLAVEQTAGGFDFRTCSALNLVLLASGSTINESTLVKNLAIQFDIYIPAQWSSGYIKFELMNGKGEWRYNYAPWATGGGEVVPVQMDGWQTVTIPISVFSGLNAQNPKIDTFKQLLDFMVNKGGSLRFVNSTYTDAGGVTYPPSAIPGFQLSFGNFRIVPYSKPAITNN